MPEPTETSTPPASVPRRRLTRSVAAIAVLAGLAAYAAVHYEAGGSRPPHCTVADPNGDESYTLQPQQAANAATIGAVGIARELPERAVAIAIATAMQESSLRNIDYGDRDSLGLFQQRPSMGWGSEAEIMDPVYASGQFYDHLVQVPDYLDLPLTVAAQKVQRSAFPDEYAKHEPQAAQLAAAFTGQEIASLNCTGVSGERVAGDATEIIQRISREFGDSVLPGSDENGRITIPIPAGTDARSGWKLAHWAVAHSAELGIERIVHDGRIWEADRWAEGWRGDEDTTSVTDSPGELRLALFD